MLFYLIVLLNKTKMNKIFLLLILLFFILSTAGILLLFKFKSYDYKEERYRKISAPISILIGIILGFVSGVVGIGGGIFLSPIFRNNKNKKFLDVIKTNLLKNLTKNQIVLLGGINEKTIKRSKLCAPSGVAAISWIKKNGPSINTGPF